MFARPVDPFQAYKSVFSAAERRHKDLLGKEDLQHEQDLRQRLGQQQRPPGVDNTNRRKRSFVFEPEFISALESVQQDLKSSLSAATADKRPCKRARCSVSFSSSVLSSELPSAVKLTPTPSKKAAPTSTPTTSLNGPSIIDLSSGEELEALHVGDSEHKRRRESIAGSPDNESLREVFDVQADGSLCPTMEHAPSQPSPTKRLKLGKPSSKSSPLQFLDQTDEVKGQKSTRRLFNHIRNKNKYRNNTANSLSSSSADLDSWMSDDDEPPRCKPTPKPELQALVRYQGPKSMSLVEGVDAFIRHSLNDDQLSLQDIQGHELVLYRGDRCRTTAVPQNSFASSSLSSVAPEPSYSSTVIEELEDDGDDDESDSLMNELQDKIMDMDLD